MWNITNGQVTYRDTRVAVQCALRGIADMAERRSTFADVTWWDYDVATICGRA